MCIVELHHSRKPARDQYNFRPVVPAATFFQSLWPLKTFGGCASCNFLQQIVAGVILGFYDIYKN